MDNLRLSLIMQTDPQWGEEIQEFLLVNPEFQKYYSIIPMTRYPKGFGRNLNEGIDPEMPRQDSVFEHLVYYIAGAGVRYTYALKQWKAISQTLRSNGYNISAMVETLKSLPLQPKKVGTYLSLEAWLSKNNILPSDLTLDIVIKPDFQKNIVGVGKGAIDHLKKFFGNLQQVNTVVDTTDRGFISGFMSIYGLSKPPTKSQIVDKISQWGRFPYVGNIMCFQVFNYGSKMASGQPSLLSQPSKKLTSPTIKRPKIIIKRL